jgi:hypothetical protein
VSGQRRLGVRLQAGIALLHVTGRVPLRGLQSLLGHLAGARLGLGEVTELLHEVAARGKNLLEALRREVRQAAVVRMDETSWREDGKNGYLWSCATETARYDEIHPSRSAATAQQVLGEAFGGVLVSDFYAGYNWPQGPHQRCWVHLLRDLHQVTEKHPQDAVVQQFARCLHRLWEWACERAAEGGEAGQGWRQEVAAVCRRQARSLALPYHGRAGPLRLLAKRLLDYLEELFVFVEHPGVPSDNNGAERSIRPAVIARKVRGGTRSERGSETYAALLRLFETWKLRGLNPYAECLALLRA